MQSSPGVAAGHDQPGLGVDDLDLDVRVHPADRGHPPVQVVVGRVWVETGDVSVMP